jgi:hypothetical protein
MMDPRTPSLLEAPIGCASASRGEYTPVWNEAAGVRAAIAPWLSNGQIRLRRPTMDNRALC